MSTKQNNKTNRIAIIDPEKCKPSKCNKECIRYCPPQSGGARVIEIEDIGKNIQKQNMNLSSIVDKKQIAKIAENLCIGCNICTKKCPFNAITIINLPYENKDDIVHRYGSNGFKLYGLPIMKTNSIIGIIGSNGIGKTTLVDILSDLIRPNFENFVTPTDTKTIIAKYRGSVLQTYLKNLYESKLKFSIKFQKLKSHFDQSHLEMNIQTYIESIGLDFEKIKTSEFFRILGIDLITVSYTHLTLPTNREV